MVCDFAADNFWRAAAASRCGTIWRSCAATADMPKCIPQCRYNSSGIDCEQSPSRRRLSTPNSCESVTRRRGAQLLALGISAHSALCRQVSTVKVRPSSDRRDVKHWSWTKTAAAARQTAAPTRKRCFSIIFPKKIAACHLRRFRSIDASGRVHGRYPAEVAHLLFGTMPLRRGSCTAMTAGGHACWPGCAPQR